MTYPGGGHSDIEYYSPTCNIWWGREERETCFGNLFGLGPVKPSGNRCRCQINFSHSGKASRAGRPAGAFMEDADDRVYVVHRLGFTDVHGPLPPGRVMSRWHGETTLVDGKTLPVLAALDDPSLCACTFIRRVVEGRSPPDTGI